MDDETLTKRVLALLGILPGWLWDETADAYPKNVTGLYYGRIPDGDHVPDKAIAAKVYGAPADGDLKIRRMQLRLRGARLQLNGADRLADLVFVVLDGLSRVGGINDIRRISMTSLGVDTNGRDERTENYQIRLDNPEASL